MQEADEESQLYDDSSYVFTADASNVPETMIEQLLAERDEDALVAHQFEEALVELQCGQKGHWRAECPKRLHSQPASGPPQLQPTNMLISASGVNDDDDEDVFVMEPTGSVLSDVFVLS